MVYYEFTEPALLQFQQLESWLAEETLDELETLSANLTVTRQRSTTGFIHDFVRLRENRKIYVFLTIAPQDKNERLVVTNVGLHIRP